MKLPKFLQKILLRNTLANPDSWLKEALGGGKSASGAIVNSETAMRVTAVYACVRILAETIASLPLVTYRRLDRGKARAPDHPLYTVLHDIPNPEMTSFTFRETMMVHLLLTGNAFAQIVRDRGGRVRELWPLNPNKIKPQRNKSTEKIEYVLSNDDGTQEVLPYEKILHIPGLGFDGLIGYSPIRMAREAIGLSLAAEQFGAEFFGNGAHFGGIIEYPGKLSDEAYERYKKDVREKYAGLGKQHQIMVLEQGLKYHQITIPPEDAQFLETRKFQVTEIARIFRVPPHMLADLERATFSNIEHQSIEFVVHTIRPWLVRWEQAIFKKLLTPMEQKEYFVEFLVDGLLRGDIKSRYEAYAVARQNGWMSANDIRELENMNPIEGGDVYLVNGNMVPIGGAGAQEKGGGSDAGNQTTQDRNQQ